MTSIWPKKCFNTGKTISKKKNVVSGDWTVFYQGLNTRKSASLTYKCRFITLEFAFESGDKYRVAARTTQCDRFDLFWGENVWCIDDCGMNTRRAVPFFCRAMKWHFRGRIGGVTTKTLPVLIRPPHGLLHSLILFENWDYAFFVKPKFLNLAKFHDNEQTQFWG